MKIKYDNHGKAHIIKVCKMCRKKMKLYLDDDMCYPIVNVCDTCGKEVTDVIINKLLKKGGD